MADLVVVGWEMVEMVAVVVEEEMVVVGMVVVGWEGVGLVVVGWVAGMVALVMVALVVVGWAAEAPG